MRVSETFIKQEHKHYQFFFCFLSFLLLRQSHHLTLAGSSWPRTHRALPNSAGITFVPLCLASFLITNLLKRKKKVEVILNHKLLPLFCSKGLIVMIMLQFLLYSEKKIKYLMKTVVSIATNAQLLSGQESRGSKRFFVEMLNGF